MSDVAEDIMKLLKTEGYQINEAIRDAIDDLIDLVDDENDEMLEDEEENVVVEDDEQPAR